jgi:hypothetical protein
VIKDGGYLLIVCPNFLSITNNFHYHTRGVVQKVKNLFGIFKRLILKNVNFSKMKVITRKDFQPDDDACNVTNPIEILNWAEKKKLKLRYWSSQSIYKDGLVNYLDFSFIKFFFGSSFFVFKKYDTQK